MKNKFFIRGAFLIFCKHINEEIANKQYSPYSTFKIVSTLMGLHNGVVMDENSKMNYDGTIYPIEMWNSNLTLGEAFDTSCIWYFRQVLIL